MIFSSLRICTQAPKYPTVTNSSHHSSGDTCKGTILTTGGDYLDCIYFLNFDFERAPWVFPIINYSSHTPLQVLGDYVLPFLSLLDLRYI